jgi:hypothetical protein
MTYEASGQEKAALEAFNKVAEIKGGKVSAELQSKVEKLKEQMQH